MALSTYQAAAAAIFVVLLYQILGVIQRKKLPKKVLRVSELYVYPIKSLRESRLDSALATQHGFKHDRRFMLLKVTPRGLMNMAVADNPMMTQFLTSIKQDSEHSGIITVTFISAGCSDKPEPLEIPLIPNIEELDSLDINMHGSPTAAYRMQDYFNKWFSACFGFDVVLAYLGENRRDVLFDDLVPAKSATWQSSIKRAIPFFYSVYATKHQITFADCAPYLITSKTSLANVSERLPQDQHADMTKFRPNIVIEGADEAWEEDFWRMVRIGDADFAMLHNCVRCQSINIDYATGKPGTDESGQLLKKLQKDRRVDKGAKWSPVFGRYSFWASGNAHKTLKVGDPVRILDMNGERSVFTWPDLS